MKLEEIVSKKTTLESSIVKLILEFEDSTGMFCVGLGLNTEFQSSGSVPYREQKVAVSVDNKVR